ncbi:MAD3 protein, partial [Trogon melanurus]|nr:MAD3 protein [Trogon melanurus]
MEPAATSIQVLLQAAEFLERRDRASGPRCRRCPAEAEHGYASLRPARSRRAGGSVSACCDPRAFFRRSVHNALEKHRYRGGGRGGERGWPSLLEEQELRARKTKDRLRNRQQNLRRQLEWLLSPTGNGERTRADSLDSSRLSEHSEGEDAEIEVDGMVFSGDLLPGFGTRRDHSYSSSRSPVS